MAKLHKMLPRHSHLKGWLLGILLLIPSLLSAYDFQVDGIYYAINTNTTPQTVGVTYKNTNYNSYSGDIIIPSSVTYENNTYQVTSIGYRAFSDCSGLTSVSIPNTVTSIGSYAFQYCYDLTSVSIPNTVTSIGSYAFQYCYGLIKSAYPSTLSNPFSNGVAIAYDPQGATVEDGILFGADKSSILFAPLTLAGEYVIPNSVTSIGNSAFRGCTGLTSVTIPNSVTSIGNNAFYGCTGLTSMIIPPSVTTLGTNAFSNCNGMKKVAFPNIFEYPFSYTFNIAYDPQGATVEDGFVFGADKSSILFAPLTLAGEYVIPNSVTSIGCNTFALCTDLTSVTLPNALTAIGDWAFSSCTSLTSVTFPNSLTTIGIRAFYNCSGLTSLTIPKSVTSIGDYAFRDTSITSLTFNATNCTTCGTSTSPAFPSSIANLTLGEGITSIPANFLKEGSQIETLTIPNSVTSIGDYAFYGMRNIKSLTVGTGVLSLGENTFVALSADSQKIPIPKVFWLGNTAPSIWWDTWATVHYASNDKIAGDNVVKYQFLSSMFMVDGTYYVPVSPSERTCDVISSDYAMSDGNVVISDKVMNRGIELSVLHINKNAFYGNRSITSLSISNKGNVGDYAFYNCPNLTTLTADNIGYLGNYSFKDCDALTSVTLNNGSYVGEEAFADCDALTSITANNGSYIAKKAFADCDALTSAIVNNDGYLGADAFAECDLLKEVTVTSNGDIGNDAFKNCKALETASINNVGSVGPNTFSECTALTNATIGDSVTYLGDSAFSGCSALTEVTIGNSVSTIGGSAFSGCSTLPSISLPDSITGIGDHIFSGCSALATVNIGAGLFYIPNYAFENCASLNNLSIPHNVRMIHDYAFTGCQSLSHLRIEDDVIEEENPEAPSPVTFADWTSTNHADNTTSSKEYTLDVKAGDTLSFDYKVDSEAGYDFLNVTAGNIEIVKVSGNKTGHYSGTFTNGGTCTLYLTYSKDGATSKGKDEATVFNITLTPAAAMPDNLQLGSNGRDPLFQDCPLDEVYIGRRLSYSTASNKGYSPFYRNTTLRSVEITDAETQIYDNEFYGCSNLKTLKIGNGVTTIGKWAFSGCSSLDYFSAGYNVQSIGDEAFSDCTGLKNYHSYSILPPVCGSQALDDINKWDCTLLVPAESSDEYMAANQWKDFFFVTENGAVAVEAIRLNSTGLDMKTGDSFQLEAEVIPANATHRQLTWSTSDATIANVDEKGMVTFLKEGFATITAHSTDGSGVEASVDVVVTVKEPALGDSNANGVVNVADAVNTANYAIGKPAEHFHFVVADVNLDGIITLADASATISLILNQTEQNSVMAKIKAASTLRDEADMLLIEDYSAKVGETVAVAVALDNTRLYTALQGDITVPEGMTLEGVNIGCRAKETHSLAVKRIDARKVRMVLFDIDNSAFADSDEAVIELIVKANEATAGQIEISNIVASDAQAREYEMISAGGENSEMADIDRVESSRIRIVNTPEGINIYNAHGHEIVICAADGTVLHRFTATSDIETRQMVSGMYLVTAGSKTQKVVVK